MVMSICGSVFLSVSRVILWPKLPHFVHRSCYTEPKEPFLPHHHHHHHQFIGSKTQQSNTYNKTNRAGQQTVVGARDDATRHALMPLIAALDKYN